MDLTSVVLEINKKGLKLNKAKINAEKGLLSTARERATKQLFDMGYLDHLGSFTDNEIVNNLRMEYGDDTKYLYSNVDGSAELTRERLRLCKYTTKNEEFITVIDILGIMLKREEVYQGLEEIDRFTDKSVFYPSIVATSVGISSKFPALSNKDILNYFDFESSTAHIADISSLVYYEFLVSLGVDENVIQLSKNNNKGILLDYLSYSQELSILDLILNYEVVPNTNYRTLYLKQRHEYYTSKDRFSQKMKYMKNNYNNVDEIVKEFLNSGLDIKLCTERYIIYDKPNSYNNSLEWVVGTNSIVESRITPSWNNIDSYCRMYTTRGIAGAYMLLSGYVGEYISNLDSKYPELDGESTKNEITYKRFNVTSKGYEEVNLLSIKHTDLTSNFSNNRLIENGDVDVIFNKFKAKDESELFKVIDTEVEKRYNLYSLDEDLSIMDTKLILRDIVYGILHALVGEDFRASYNNQEVLKILYETDCIYKVSEMAQNILKKYRII